MAHLGSKGIGVMPNQPRLHVCAVRAWFAGGNLKRAAPHVDWLIEHKAGGALPHAARAMMLLRQDQIEPARAEAQTALDLEKDAPEGHLAMGIVLARTGHPEQARAEFRFVLESPQAGDWLKAQAQRMLDDLPR